jgi:hypothetical protein
MGQPGQNSSTYTAAAGNVVLDGDMTATDIVAALEQLRFDHGLRTIKVDGAVRDFLVGAVSALRRKG